MSIYTTDVMGVTSVTFKNYMMGHIGMIPDATLFCLVGASIASLSKLNETGIGSDKTVLIITIVLTVIAIIGIIYMGVVSKKELTKIAQYDNGESVLHQKIDLQHHVHQYLHHQIHQYSQHQSLHHPIVEII